MRRYRSRSTHTSGREAFHPTNGVAQGSPLSPILYLLVIQSFISLIDTSPELQGVAIPGTGGDEQRPPIHKDLVFADDVLLSLKDEDQLVPFKKLLHIYEHGTGAKNVAKNAWLTGRGIKGVHPPSGRVDGGA